MQDLRNNNKKPIIALLSGRYTKNVLETFKVIKENNFDIQYAEIFPLYGTKNLRFIRNNNTTLELESFLKQDQSKAIIWPITHNNIWYTYKSLFITQNGEFLVPPLLGAPEKTIKKKDEIIDNNEQKTTKKYNAIFFYQIIFFSVFLYCILNNLFVIFKINDKI